MTAVFGHRGAPAEAPENTLPGFRAALAAGADGVELDVRRTADGALAVHHDPALADGRLLATVPAADLPAAVPTLDAVLDACRDVVVNVEVKALPGEPDHDPDHRLAHAVAALVAPLADRVLVSSFDLGALRAVRDAAPAVPLGLLAMLDDDPGRADRLVARAGAEGCAAVHPCHPAVTAHLVEAAHAAGLAVNTWTVNAPARMRALAALGVDALITDDPRLARTVLADRP